MTTSTEPLIFPVGHYTGAFHPTVGAPVRYHSLRIGELGITLDDEQALGVWAAAHRPLDRPDQPWTRTAVANIARTLMGIADPESIMDEFFETGVLVEVEPGTQDAIGFARAHRVEPLMIGLGNTPDHPLTCGIGFLGAAPVVTVPTLVFDILQWGSLANSLWDVCAAFATAGAQGGVSNTDEHNPEYVLTTFLTSLYTLLGPNAAYIDEARGL
ncbi:MAG: hypothetical protein HKP61_11880 [Dactylosporangium sp.]|nr:hypothetical protein [Dactylosporangium sp.]NNJ61623.1 hypothetical protein [Dactylosporangium sp.]